MSTWGAEEAAATIVVTGGEEEARTALMVWLGVASPRFVDGLLAREQRRWPFLARARWGNGRHSYNGAGEKGKTREEAEMSSPQVEGDMDGAGAGGREAVWQRRDVGGRGEKEVGDVAGEAMRAGAMQRRAQLGATRGWSAMKWKAIIVVAACIAGRRRQQHSLWQRWIWEEDGGKGGAPTSSVETLEMAAVGENDAFDGSSTDGGSGW
ncbi:hypothetical protein GW17_00034020 [Ensete ventricosum]|nr:hypothetical protein GW17_00034020 [Ensete ventricosum]